MRRPERGDHPLRPRISTASRGRAAEKLLGVPVRWRRDARAARERPLLIHPPFRGTSASHPEKALAPGYVLPVIEQARAAGARLPE
jgi:hypothetical protein